MVELDSSKIDNVKEKYNWMNGVDWVSSFRVEDLDEIERAHVVHSKTLESLVKPYLNKWYKSMGKEGSMDWDSWLDEQGDSYEDVVDEYFFGSSLSVRVDGSYYSLDLEKFEFDGDYVVFFYEL